MTFGEVLFGLRKEKGMSKEELALLLGVKTSDVESWERNEVFPSDEQLGAIAEIFDFDSEDFKRALKRGGAEAERINRLDSPRIRLENEPFYPSLPEDEKLRLKKLRRKRVIFFAVDGLLFLCALATFLIFGLTQDKWHPAWAAFPAAATVGQLIYVLTFKRNALTVIIESLWLISAAIFFISGAFFGVWHPTWLIFVADIILTVAINIAYAYTKRRK